MWLSIIILVYLLSAGFSYNWIKNAYSVGGVFHCRSNNAGIEDMIFTLTPFVNTIFAIMMFCSSGNGKENSSITTNKFFGVNK